MIYILIVLIIAQILSKPDNNFLVWPLPKFYALNGGSISLSSKFNIKTSSSSDILKVNIQNYKAFIGTGVDVTPALDELNIEVVRNDESLNSSTFYNYTVIVDNYKARIIGETVYGAIYGLETFSQLINNNKLNYSYIKIDDEPNFVHRGIMADTGRRFIPIHTLKLLLDSMLYNKLNVLHLHLADWCRVALESKVYPMLTAGLTGLQEGFYTQEEMKDIVTYAKYRGIRIIPEFDLPGHSKGWSPLAEVGMEFCDDRKFQLYGDPNNKTFNVLKNYLNEIINIFPDEIIHFGCDELTTTGKCNPTNFAQLESYIFDYVYNVHGKRPAGWEEILYSTKIATKYSVVSNWQHHVATESTNKGYDSIENHGPNFYLNHFDYLEQWVNITELKPAYLRSNSNDEKGQFYGAEFSMWTDNYCYIAQCGTSSGKPIGYQLYDPKYNKEFEESFLSMIYPRGIKAAGSFYRYDSEFKDKDEDFLMRIFVQNNRITERGILTCPRECQCNEINKCGKPYIKA